MSIHLAGKSCSDLGAVLVLNDPRAGRGERFVEGVHEQGTEIKAITYSAGACTHSLFSSSSAPSRDRCHCFHGAFQSPPVQLNLSTFEGTLSVVCMDQTAEVELERERSEGPGTRRCRSTSATTAPAPSSSSSWTSSADGSRAQGRGGGVIVLIGRPSWTGVRRRRSVADHN